MFKKDGIDAPSDKVSTVIGKDTVFQGTLNGKGLIRIDGEAEGAITGTGDIVIGESGRVQAELKARNITIAGSYEGKLVANGKLELKSTARVSGTINANGLIVEDGANMCGNLSMDEKAKKESLATREQGITSAQASAKPGQ